MVLHKSKFCMKSYIPKYYRVIFHLLKHYIKIKIFNFYYVTKKKATVIFNIIFIIIFSNISLLSFFITYL